MIDCTSNMRTVRDQGRRGTCAAFATTAAHEHARAVRRGPLADELSVELLFWRCKRLDGNSDDGTGFNSVRDALTDPGQCDEVQWPYMAVRDLAAAYDPPEAAASATKFHATMSPIACDVAAITMALSAGRPVVAGLQLWEGFYQCASALLAVPAGDIDASALHAVCLTGLDEDNSTIMVRNSWGTSWGRRGYAWMDLVALPSVLLEAWTVADDLDPD